MAILKLIQSKSRSVDKFLLCSQLFLKEIQTGDFSQLERFQNQRERLCKAFELYDRKISEEINQTPKKMISQKMTEILNETVTRQAGTLQEILKTDQEITNHLEQEKTRLLQELVVSEKNNTLFKKFKSNWVSPSGDKLDDTL